MRQELKIPDWTPTSLNKFANVHWTKRKKIKDADTALMTVYGLAQCIRCATGRRKVSLVISGYGRGGPFPDPDNLWKSLLDALKNAGLLVNDTQQYCEMGDVKFVRSTKRQTIIILEDLPDES